MSSLSEFHSTFNCEHSNHSIVCDESDCSEVDVTSNTPDTNLLTVIDKSPDVTMKDLTG